MVKIIDKLATVIRKHQEQLPNVKLLEVDEGFDKVYRETEDGNLHIDNEMYVCSGLRKVHLEVATLGPLDILHCIWYPEPEYNLPIFGADIVANKNIVSAAITDLSPVDGISSPIYEEIAPISNIYNFANERENPAWGDIFSPYCKFARLQTDEEKDTFCNVVDEYLDKFVGAVWRTKPSSNRASERKDGQIHYCSQQKMNDKTRRILAKYFGDDWADFYINQILFDFPQ